jgi:acetoin utilization protein AcuC
VPRAWAHLVAVAAGRPLDPATPVPAGWRRAVEALGLPAPATMSDGADPAYRPWSAGYDPHSALDRAVLATRTAVFPWHGLDPHSAS